MTDSTQPQDVAGAASGTGQAMPRTGTGQAASVDVATQVRATQALGRAPWRTLPPVEPCRSPEPRRSAP